MLTNSERGLGQGGGRYFSGRSEIWNAPWQLNEQQLVAKIVDQVSDKLREINRAVLATEAAAKKAHAGGADAAEVHRRSTELLKVNRSFAMPNQTHMLRYLVCTALLLSATWLFMTAARLLIATHRLAKARMPVSPKIDAPHLTDRQCVTSSVGEITERTLH